MKNIYDREYYHLINRNLSHNNYCTLEMIRKTYGKDLTGLKALEIGCGPGDMMERLREMGAECTGVEISESSRAVCKQKGFDVIRIDISNEELSHKWENQFDLVVMVHVLEHIFDHIRVLANANKALTLNGRLFTMVPNFNNPRRILNYIIGRSCTQLENIGHLRFFSKRYLSDLLRIQGFEPNIKADPYLHDPLLVRPNASELRITLVSFAWWLLRKNFVLLTASRKIGTPQFDSIYDIFPPGDHTKIIRETRKTILP